jgi:D-lactate dehydrogenase (cytochrome)
MRAASGSIGGILGSLADLLGDRVTAAQPILESHGRSEAYQAPQLPQLVAFPESPAEVQQIVRLCARAGMPIVPFGAGTSLEGNAAAPSGGLCLDMTRMNRVLAVNAEDMDVQAQPGITPKQLNAALRNTGLFFPIDPGADASIGGMASTRASGTMAVRYGTMTDNVLSLEVVLANGRLMRTGSRARKSSAGYDLTALFVGAEGTLGVITEITLKLHPRPEAISAAVCAFPDLKAAVDTAINVIQSAIPIARVELLDDDVMMRGVNGYAKFSYREAPTLFFEFHGSTAGVAEQAQRTQAIAANFGGLGFEWATTPEDRTRLWNARDNTLYAGVALRPGARAMITDVCVPTSRLAECLTLTEQDLKSSGLIAPLVGHAGDGNFHLLILINPGDAEEIARAKAFHARLVERAIALDGTCTGERGVGRGKIQFAEQELGNAVNAMRTIKHALDPHNIMNPGKIFRMPALIGASIG